MVFAATWMDLEIITVCEVNQPEKDKYYMISLICRMLKKKIQMNLSTKQKQTQKLRERIYGYQEERVGGGIDQGFEFDMYTLLYLKYITNKALLYSIGDSSQSVIT